MYSLGNELDAATATLERAGIPHPQLLALNTWAVLARAQPGVVWSGRAEPLPAGAFPARFRDAIARQAAGEPFQYAVGQVAFRTLDLAVDRRVIIPRMGSEGLVDEVLGFVRQRATSEGWGVVAEIGTGSGAIALSLAVEGRFSRVIATDVSAAALEVAAANVAARAPATAVELRLGDWLEPLVGERVDVIVANPPCVPSADWEHLLPRVRDYEPRLAFDGGPDGLAPARALMGGARAHLTPGGLLALEVDPDSGPAILDLARTSGWRDARVRADPAERGLYFLATAVWG
jgi:release factor glutamine methyltransferase